MRYLNFRSAIKGNNPHLMTICGCTKRELRLHIQAQFKPGMTWDNYGNEWEVDHITPVRFFEDTRAGEEALHHFSNLQPLWVQENRKKRNRMGKMTSDTHPVVQADREKQEAHHKKMAEKWGPGWRRLKSMTVFECGDWVMEPTYV